MLGFDKPNHTNWSSVRGSSTALVLMALLSGASAMRRFCSSASNSLSGNCSASKSRVNVLMEGLWSSPFCTKFITLSRACWSVIWPDKNASCASSNRSALLCWGSKKVDKRVSCKATAHGSPKWSVPPARASSRRIRRAQSCAPCSNQLD